MDDDTTVTMQKTIYKHSTNTITIITTHAYTQNHLFISLSLLSKNIDYFMLLMYL